MNAEEFQLRMQSVKTELTDKILSWANDCIDEFVKGKPMLSVISEHVKQRVKNELNINSQKAEGMIDELLMWVMDEDGNIKMDQSVDDMITILKNLPETPFEWRKIKGVIGNGIIQINFPDHPLLRPLYGETRGLRITDIDLLKLKGAFMS